MVNPGPDDKVYPPFRLAILVDTLVAEGISAQDALRGTDISVDAVRSPATRLSLNQRLQVHRNADRLSRDPHFAYRQGLRIHTTTLGMFGFALLSSPSLRRAADFVMKYHQLASPLVACCFSQDGDDGVWTVKPPAHPTLEPRMHKYLVELQYGVLVAVNRDITGGAFSPRELRVTYDAPTDAAAYPELFGCPMLFGQSDNQLRFDARFLDRKPDLGNEMIHTMVQKICDGLLEEFKLNIGLTGTVRHFLMSNLMRTKSFEDVAEHLRMNERTLRRKLAEENTSYRRLVDELRRDVAIQYLRDTDMTVEDIADTPGFSDAANFRHAFRRWTQATPNQYRGRSSAA